MDHRYINEGGYFKHHTKLKSPKRPKSPHKSPHKSSRKSPTNRFDQLRKLYREQTKELHTLKEENQQLRETLYKFQNPQ